MKEYIERDSAAAFAYDCGAVYVSNRLSNKNAFPAADVELVRHGRWVVDGVYVVCSVCNGFTLSPIIKQLPTFKYCPNCGAKMDLEEG